jgi:amino acid permease
MDWGTRAPRSFRGTYKRIRRVRMVRRERVLVWLFVAWLVVLLFMLLPYVARHSTTEHEWHSNGVVGR